MAEEKKYIIPLLDIVEFQNEDIITKSYNEGTEDGEDW